MSMVAPAQFPPEGSAARIVPFKLVTPIPALSMPPPDSALLPEKVQFVIADRPEASLKMPPPLSPPVLPENVLFVSVSLAPLKMPPPKNNALFPENVLLVTAAVPPGLSMPPPALDALLSKKVVLVIVIIPPLLMMPPPLFAKFSENVLLRTVSVPKLLMPPPRPVCEAFWKRVQLVTVNPPLLKMPAPLAAEPFSMVRFDMLTVTAGRTTFITPIACCASIAIPGEVVGPVMVTLAVNVRAPFAGRSWIVPVKPAANTIVSPPPSRTFCRMAPRRLPSPATGVAGSVVLVTVKVAARANPVIARTRSANIDSASAARRLRYVIEPQSAALAAAWPNFQE